MDIPFLLITAREHDDVADSATEHGVTAVVQTATAPDRTACSPTGSAGYLIVYPGQIQRDDCRPVQRERGDVPPWNSTESTSLGRVRYLAQLRYCSSPVTTSSSCCGIPGPSSATVIETVCRSTWTRRGPKRHRRRVRRCVRRVRPEFDEPPVTRRTGVSGRCVSILPACLSRCDDTISVILADTSPGRPELITAHGPLPVACGSLRDAISSAFAGACGGWSDILLVDSLVRASACRGRRSAFPSCARPALEVRGHTLALFRIRQIVNISSGRLIASPTVWHAPKRKSRKLSGSGESSSERVGDAVHEAGHRRSSVRQPRRSDRGLSTAVS